MRVYTIITISVFAILFMGCQRTSTETPNKVTETSSEQAIAHDADGRPLTYALLGKKLPAFALQTLDGAPYSFDKPENWTVLAFWGIWCGDCRVDGPYQNALSVAIAQDADLNFMSVHTPPSAKRAEEAFGRFGSIDAYMDANNYSFPVAIDADATVRELAQIRWTPTYLLVDNNGVVRMFRTDLSVDKNQPVKDFIRDIAAIKRDSLTNTP